MERIAHLIAPVASLILGIGWLIPAGVETRTAAPEPAAVAPLLSRPSLPSVRVRSGDGADRDLAGWAVGRFSEAGLDLPEVTITFHDDDAPCRGNTGLYRPGPPAEVHLCISDGRPETVRKLITLHELGHAWAEDRPDVTARDAFLGVRGLDSWRDGGQPRHLWGAEHAAEAISWALMDEPVRIIRIDDAGPEALSEAFRALTGVEPLNAVEA